MRDASMTRLVSVRSGEINPARLIERPFIAKHRQSMIEFCPLGSCSAGAGAWLMTARSNQEFDAESSA
jgi:hypothetical protein